MNSITKKSKRIVSLLLSVLMLLNLTVFVSAQTAKLAAKMYWTADLETGAWTDAQNAGAVFDCADFEPGSEAVRYIKVENTGKRAISYALSFVSEAEINDLANVIDVYASENVKGNTAISEMTSVGTLAEVVNGTAFSSGDILPGTLTDDDFYSGNTVVAVALKMKGDASIEYKAKTVDNFSIKLTAFECAYDNYPSVDKFELVFPNTNKYIYRVGNANAVKLGSLFGAIDGAEIGNVTVQIEKLDSLTDVSGTYTSASDWKNSTIQFTGTGPVKVTIDDDDFANALSLNLEVINATNLTSAASVTSKDAVLLNDVTFSTITVNNGHTLYGNGFKLSKTTDIWGYGIGDGFVTLSNGTIDNARIVCPNFSYQILYQKNQSEEGNVTDGNKNYGNVRSAVVMSGNSKIVNSYVSGGRAAIYAPSGYPVIENSTIYGGAAANIHVGNVKNLLLKDATLVQEPIQANVNDTSKILMGLSVFVETNTDYPIITLEGDFVQYAWAHKGYGDYVPNLGVPQDPVSIALGMEQFQHTITYKDGTTVSPSVNLGFISGGNSIDSMITDNRDNKDSIPYSEDDVSLASVYSYNNEKGLDESFATFPEYSSECSANIPATLQFSESLSGLSYVSSYDADEGQQATLTADLDTLGAYTFSFDKLVAEKYGRNLSYTVKDSSGNTIDKSAAITLSDTGVNEYILEITDDVYYGVDGQVESGKSETYSYDFSLIATKTSINRPEIVGENTYEDPILLKLSGDWTPAIPASLGGITIKYYSTDAKDYKELNLGNIIPTSKGKQNGTKNYWEYTGTDYKFKVTCGYIHEGKKVYGMPVVVDNSGNKMYFVISDEQGVVSTDTASRTVTLTYDFTDNNGQTKTFSHTWNAVYADMGTDYKYSEFVNGTLEKNCLAEGTLITLADGTQKAIEELTFEDEVLVWDFFNGEYTSAVPTLLINDGKKEYDVITLNFDDGTSVRTIYEHGFFGVEENDYVLINANNVNDYIGHAFVKNNGSENETVTLQSYEITNEYIGCYTMLTAFHNNCIANGMLTVTPPPIDGWYDYFEIGEGMKYDEEAMNADIEKYGLYTYDDFSDYITYEEFLAFNGPYLKVLVGKGYITFDDILEQIAVFGVGESGISALSEDEEITILASGNKVSSADYQINVSAEGATEADGVYTLTQDVCAVTLTATGTATKGYATITIDGETFTTANIASGESITINVKNVNNAQDKTLTIAYNWGVSDAEAVLENNADIDFGEFTMSTDGATVTLLNTTKYPVTGMDVYIAVYEGNACVFVAKSANVTVEGKKEYTFAPEYALPDGATVKAFVWEADTMTPVF